MKRLRAWLVEHEKTQADLAESVGVSEGAISQWLSGTSRPSLDSVIALAKETGISVNSLVADLPKRAAAYAARG